MSTIRQVCIAAILAGILCGCGKAKSPSASASPDSKRLTIAVIPKGTTHVYWKSVQAGALQAAKELNVDVVWKGPLKESDRQDQIDLVEQFVTDGVSAIVLAPLDKQMLLRPVQEAADRKIPVVIIDSALVGTVGKDFAAFVATDNQKGGFIGGQELARLLGGRGKVVLLRYMEGSASTEEREAGFLEAIGQNAGISVTVKNRYGGATADSALKEAMNMLDQLKEADGVFCPNESTTVGMLTALRNGQLAGKIKFVGFDASPELVKALQNSEIDALVSQDPVHMGYLGVKTAVAIVRGEKFDATVDTGEHLITRQTMDTPEIKSLLAPLP